MKISKYDLPTEPEEFDIQLPSRYNAFCSMQLRDGLPVVWFQVGDEESAHIRPFKFKTVFTGQKYIGRQWRFLGTVQLYNGLVMHLLAWQLRG